MSADSTHAQEISQQKFALATLAAGQTVVWSCMYYVFPALLVRWENSLFWSKLQLTGAITLALLVSAGFSPLFGRIVDRGHGPYLMAGGAVVGGICIFLLSLTTMLWQFYFIWAVVGVCFAACLYEPCFALLTRAYGEGAKRGIIVVTLVAGFAGMISFPAAHYIAELWGWKVVTQSFGLCATFIGMPLLFYGASIVERHRTSFELPEVWRQPSAHKWFYLNSPVFLRLAIAFALLAVVHGATLHHILHILSDRGLTLGTSVLVASLIGPMQVFGRLVLTAFQKRLSHKLIAYCCFICMGCSMALLYLSYAGVVLAVLFAVVFGSGYGMVSIIRPVIARELLGDDNFGAKSGLLAFFYLLGAAASPYAGSLVWVIGGYDSLIILLLVLAFAGLWLIYLALVETQNSVQTHTR